MVLKNRLTKASQDDLYRADIWSLGILLFALINPDLSFPYENDFEACPGEQWTVVLKKKLATRKRPTMSPVYNNLQQSTWKPILELIDSCLQFEPNERPSTKMLLPSIAEMMSIKVDFRSQDEAQETYDKEIALGNDITCPKNIGNNACSFLSISIIDNLFCETEFSTNPHNLMKEIKRSAEFAVDFIPLAINPSRDMNKFYDVSEAYQLLSSMGEITRKYNFIEQVLDDNSLYSESGRKALSNAMVELCKSDNQFALCTCGSYVFIVACIGNKLIVIDTHVLSPEVGGNFGGLIKVYQNTSLETIEAACIWIEKRMKTSGVKEQDAKQSFLIMKPILLPSSEDNVSSDGDSVGVSPRSHGITKTDTSVVVDFKASLQKRNNLLPGKCGQALTEPVLHVSNEGFAGSVPSEITKHCESVTESKLLEEHAISFQFINHSDEEMKDLDGRPENFIDSSADPTIFFQEYPVLAAGRKTRLTSEEAAQILLNPRINPKLICESVQPRVQRNYAFLVNLHALDHNNDITADDNGAYKGGQGRKSHVYFESDDEKIISLRAMTEKSLKGTNENHFLLTKYNSVCKSLPDFHRCIIRLKPEPGSEEYFQYCIVQYLFDKEEHDFEVSCHGNSKRGASYKQTSKSVRESLQESLSQNMPKQAIYKVGVSVGGRLAAKSSSSLPRNYKQAVNMKCNSQKASSTQPLIAKGSKDILAEVMEQCKKTMNNPSKAFVWKVEGAPEPMCVIGTEACFRDIERYCCTAPQGQHSVLSIDPTFDLGEFAFTPTTYVNKAVLNVSSGKNKINIGPSFVHYRKKFSSYHYFTTAMVNVNQNISSLRCYGTDGEENLRNACEKTWPLADSLRCMLHSKKNVKSHLCSYLPGHVAEEFMKEIYGERHGSHYQEGLCDIKEADVFVAMVNSLEEKWNAREKPFRTVASSQSFHKWFLDNVMTHMQASMLKSVRERNGVHGNYTTNNSESLNAALKRKMNYHANDLPEFLKLLKEFYDDQEEVVRDAFIGEGDYRFSDGFKKFELGQEYYNLTKQQRLLHEKRFYSNEHEENVVGKSFHAVRFQHGSQMEQIPNLSAKHSFNILRKASAIIHKSLIIPSFSKGCYHVTSSSDSKPHYVKQVKEGVYKCDPEDP